MPHDLIRRLLACAAACALPLAAHADPVPSAVGAMIDAAAATGDPAQLKTVADVAKKTNPGSAKEIDAQVAALTAKAEKERVEKLSHLKPQEGWKGQVQLGFASSTGTSSTTSFSAGAKVVKDTVNWHNEINLTADYQKDNGALTKERYFAGYEANYHISPRFYALGTVSWDRDTFAGYSNRFSESVGLGYQVIARPTLTLGLEGGPGFRYTEYVASQGLPGYDQSRFGARLAAKLGWTIRPNLLFTEDLTSFIQSGDNTLASNTAITAKLVGSLSARAAFLVQYESEPPAGISNTSTATRLTLVYGF
jgi:putative salt-induced outer membrane protein